MKFLLIFFAVLLFVFGSPARAFQKQAEITFNWEPNSEPDLAGYRLYYRSLSSRGLYKFCAEIDKEVSSYTITVQANRSYSFILTAYDEEGFESGFSNEAIYEGKPQDNLTEPEIMF